MNLSCPECGEVFELDTKIKPGDQLSCPHCNFRAKYDGPITPQEVSLEYMGELTPYEETVVDFQQEQAANEEEQRRMNHVGYDYKGTNAWRSFMRNLGRLQS